MNILFKLFPKLHKFLFEELNGANYERAQITDVKHNKECLLLLSGYMDDCDCSLSKKKLKWKDI